jgi:DNA-binding beta-propeller fold protein YncE
MSRLADFISVLVLGLVLGAFAPSSAHAQPNASAPGASEEAAAPYLYVCNQGEATVSIIDMETRTVVDRLDLQALGFSENAKPHHAVADPDGEHWYLSLIGENTVLKLTSDHQIAGRVDVETPGMLALQPGGSLLYVGRSMSAVNPPTSLGVVDRSSMTLETVDTFFPRPHALIASPDGKSAYVASLATNQLLRLDAGTREVELSRFGGATQTLVQFAATPDGQTLVGGGQVTGQVLFFDASNPKAITVTDTVAVGGMPWHPVISPDGSTAYVPVKGQNAVAVIDVASRTLTGRIEGRGLAEPHGSALSPDGRFLFVSNNNRKGAYTPEGDDPQAGTVVVIDTQSQSIVDVIEVGRYPTGIGTIGGQTAVLP